MSVFFFVDIRSMNEKQLRQQIVNKASMLCVGLDTDPKCIPKHLKSGKDPVFEFNQAIIDATRDLCVAYKPNLAFYEALGAGGWDSLKKTVDYIGKTHFIILDAKRGDIGNTANQYAKAFFEEMKADAVTLSPYMGYDSVEPFLKYENKYAILLLLTSNPGNKDLQMVKVEEGQYFYEKVLETSRQWTGVNRLMYVVGATRTEQIRSIRAKASESFFLVPGIGAQGGNLQEVLENGCDNRKSGLLINASRSILYASSASDFQEASRRAAEKLQLEMLAFIGK